MMINVCLNKLASILIAKSVTDMYEGAIPVEGTIIEDGFRYSFKLPPNIKISANDLNRLKARVQKNIDRNYKIEYKTLTSLEANQIFAYNPYKTELIKDLNEVKIIKLGEDYVDVCDNLQIDKTNKIKSLILTNVSGCYFLGDSTKEQLVVIDGYAFENKESAEQFTLYLEEKKERDHRKIGQDLELFMFDQTIGQGLPIWLPNGTAIKLELENYCKQLLQRNEYKFVQTPVLGTIDLYKISGHWDHYRENMFPPIKVDNEEYVLKPMSCPHHIVIYKRKPHSYTQLPYRMTEFVIQHRYEASGSLTGLERVRQMQLVDTHTVLMPSQIETEIKRVYNIISEAHSTLGTSLHSIELSLHDKNDKEKFFDNEQMWNNAENQLRKALQTINKPFKEVIGEAAFYGPKIDMQIKTALGHIITVSTIQLDFLLPERFDLKYIDSNGNRERPVFIHAGIIGTFERYIAILLEQTKGALPLWLSPNQIIIIPISNEKHYEHSRNLQIQLIDAGFRAIVDNSNNRLTRKIHDAQVKKIPYQLVIGDKELLSNTITYREYGKKDQTETTIVEFYKILQNRINSKK